MGSQTGKKLSKCEFPSVFDSSQLEQEAESNGNTISTQVLGTGALGPWTSSVLELSALGLSPLGLEDLTVLGRSSGGQGHKLLSLAVCDPLCHCLSISCGPPVLTILGLFSPQVSVTAFRTQPHSPSLLGSTELGCGRSSCGTQKARQELGIGCSWDQSRAIVSSSKSWDPSGSPGCPGGLSGHCHAGSIFC